MGNQKIEFNGAGISEVSDKVGAELLEKYSNMVYAMGNLPKKDKPVVTQINEGEAKELVNRIEKLQSLNSEQKEHYEKKIAILENEVSAWKKEFEKAKKEIGNVTEQAIGSKEFEVLENLIEQNINDLKTFAVEKLRFERPTVESFKKPKLIAEIFKSILNADNA
jgi:hypothetical protein